MSETKRWLDELPLASAERELLLAGKAARPPSGAADANWRALGLALGASATAVTGGSAAQAAAVGATTSGFVTKAGAGGLFGAATVKSFAVGIALGLSVGGASAVIQHVRHGGTEQATAIDRPPTRDLRSRAPAMPARAAEERDVAAAPLPAANGTASSSPSEPRAAAGTGPTRPEAAPPALSASTASADASLATQARELSVVKRLLDAGHTAEALSRLQASYSAGALPTLTEERDALYVQALARAQRRTEARVLAQRFVDRYPRSPYLETMRRLAEE